VVVGEPMVGCQIVDNIFIQLVRAYVASVLTQAASSAAGPASSRSPVQVHDNKSQHSSGPARPPRPPGEALVHCGDGMQSVRHGFYLA
jgi:hypothetical protein